MFHHSTLNTGLMFMSRMGGFKFLTTAGGPVKRWFLFPVRWQFASDGADIGFGVYRRNKEDSGQKVADMTQVLPSERYNAHMVPEDSCLTCSEPGVCECQSLTGCQKNSGLSQICSS